MKKESEYQVRYQKTKCYCLCLKLNKETDKDIIEILNSVSNKQGFIKELIRSNDGNFDEYNIYRDFSKDHKLFRKAETKKP